MYYNLSPAYVAPSPLDEIGNPNLCQEKRKRKTKCRVYITGTKEWYKTTISCHFRVYICTHIKLSKILVSWTREGDKKYFYEITFILRFHLHFKRDYILYDFSQVFNYDSRANVHKAGQLGIKKSSSVFFSPCPKTTTLTPSVWWV